MSPVNPDSGEIMATIRAFIAIDLTAEIQRELNILSEELNRIVPPRSVRWIPANNIHLTLQFLGDIPTDNIPGIRTVLETVANDCPRFDLNLGGIGAFPSIKRPRVIWVGVEAPRYLYKLQSQIESGLEKAGILPDDHRDERSRGSKKFSPHLTVGRVNRGASTQDLDGLSTMLKGVDPHGGGHHINRSTKPISMLVKEVNLIKSDLRPSGAVYTRLFSAELKSQSIDEEKPCEGA